MGFLAEDYCAVGGFVPPAAGEDVDLVRRLAARVDITWAATVPVATGHDCRAA